MDVPLLLPAFRQPRTPKLPEIQASARRVARQMARDGSTREEALARVRAQMPIEEKRRLADHVVDNSGSLAETRRQVRALFAELVAEDERPEPAA